jgi:hypothetical protein
MSESAPKGEAEEQRICQQIQTIRRELDALQARLDELSRDREGPAPGRTLRTDFRIVAAPEPAAQESVRARLIARPSAANPVEPREVLQQLPRGAALFIPEVIDGPNRDVALLVRADSEDVAQLGADPLVEFRAGLFTPLAAGGVGLPVLVRIGPVERGTVYEAWASEYGPGLSKLLQALAAQECLAISLYGDSYHVERTLRVPNDLRTFAREVLSQTGGMPRLSADAMHQARQAVYRQYPTARALWKALEP